MPFICFSAFLRLSLSLPEVLMKLRATDRIKFCMKVTQHNVNYVGIQKGYWTRSQKRKKMLEKEACWQPSDKEGFASRIKHFAPACPESCRAACSVVLHVEGSTSPNWRIGAWQNKLVCLPRSMVHEPSVAPTSLSLGNKKHYHTLPLSCFHHMYIIYSPIHPCTSVGLLLC